MNISHRALSCKPRCWGTSGEPVLNAVKLQSCICSMDMSVLHTLGSNYMGGHKNQQHCRVCFLLPCFSLSTWTEVNI